VTPSHISRSADVREAVGRQLQSYRLARKHAAAEQRQLLAAQAAELHTTVSDTLADLGAHLASNAEAQRDQLYSAVAAIRTDVANLLQTISTERRTRNAAAQSRRSQELRDLREQMAQLLQQMSVQRSEQAASQAAQLQIEREARGRDVADLLSELRTERPVSPARPARPVRAARPAAPPPAQGNVTAQRIGRAGIMAYVQMARVSILRAFEDGASGEAQAHQISSHVDGLIGSVRPFLVEAMATLDKLAPTERSQLSETVAGVYRNVVALIHELEAAPWPTATSQRQSFLRLVEDVRRQISPLRDELAAAAHTLQDDEPAQVEPTRPAEPPPEPPPVRSYRDNLTTIHGIGPALQQRLDRAGICTYIQLALSSPEELRKMLGEAGRLANVEDWIVQARSLAGMPD
jgi:predicted flap endonuclease-1-like 5' DNA nuclease